jgi:hypothetical protein
LRTSPQQYLWSCIFHMVQMHISYSSCTKIKTNVFSSVPPCLVLNWKGIEYSAKTRLPLQLWRYHLPFAITHVTLNWYNSSLIFLLPSGRKYNRLSRSLFLAINAKWGEVLSPKQKDCTTPFQNFQKPKEVFISIGIL